MRPILKEHLALFLVWLMVIQGVVPLLSAFPAAAAVQTGRSPSSIVVSGPLAVGHPICGGVGLDGKLQAPCAPTRATYKGKLVTSCPKGQYLDLFAGACYACPSGYNRTWSAVDAPDACSRPTKANVFTDYKPAKFLHRGKACPSGQIYDPIDGGTCWSCPSGYVRSATGIKEDKACTRFHQPKVARASFVRKASCPRGSFFDPRKGGECWSCPSGYNRTAAPVTAGDACLRPARDGFARATDHGKGRGLLGTDCGSGQFWDPNGRCYSCPSGYKRTAYGVRSAKACSRAIPVSRARAKYVSHAGCQSGSFFDPRKGGECWRCPSGYKRTAAAVTANNACVQPSDKNTLRIMDEASARYEGPVCGIKGAFDDPRNGGECWICPSGYERTVFGVTARNACGRKAVEVKPVAVYTPIHCNQYGSSAFYDPIDGGSCWTCPTGYTRNISSVKANDACITDGLNWVPSGFRDPGPLGLDGAAEVAVEILSDPKAVDAAIQRLAEKTKDKDPQALRTEIWERLADNASRSTTLRGLLLLKLYDTYADPTKATPAEKKFAKAFEGYIRARKVDLAQNAMDALKNWRHAQELRKKAAANQRARHHVPPSLTEMFDYGTVPPDFQVSLAESIIGPATAAASAVGVAAGYMAPNATSEALNAIMPFFQGAAKKAIRNMVRKAAEEAGKRLTRTELMEQVGPKLASALGDVAAGPMIIVGFATIIAEIAIDQATQISDALPKLERAIATAQRENLRLNEWKSKPEIAGMIRTYWALAIQTEGPLPRAVAAAAKAAAAIALNRPELDPNHKLKIKGPTIIHVNAPKVGTLAVNPSGTSSKGAGTLSVADLVAAARAGVDKWTVVDGKKLSAISAAPDGTLWAIDGNGRPVRYDTKAGKWDAVPAVRGQLARIGGAPGGQAWAVDRHGQVLRFDGKRWLPIKARASDIAVGPKGSVWALGGLSDPSRGAPVLRWDGKRFVRLSDFANRIAVGVDGNPWVVNKVGAVYRFDGKRWLKMIAKDGLDVGLGVNGAAVAVVGGKVEVLDAKTGAWPVLSGGPFTAVAVAADGRPWAVARDGRLYAWKGSGKP